MTEQKTEVKKTKTIVSYIEAIAVKGVKDRATLAQKVFEQTQKDGMTKNCKGKKIELEKVQSLINAFIRDINNKRDGKWSALKVNETETALSIVPK